MVSKIHETVTSKFIVKKKIVSIKHKNCEHQAFLKNFFEKSFGIAKTHFKMLYFHAVRGADAGTKINNPRGAVRTRQNIPKLHRVRAVRGAVDISSLYLVTLI